MHRNIPVLALFGTIGGFALPVLASRSPDLPESPPRSVPQISASDLPIKLACRGFFRRRFYPCEPVPPTSWVKPCADGVLLQVRLEKDKPVFLETTTDTTQKMVVMQMEILQSQRQTFINQLTLVEEDAEGNWVVDIIILDAKVSPDIASSSETNPLEKLFKSWIGTKLRYYLGPDRTIRKIEGGEKLLELAQTHPQMVAMAKNLGESLKSFFDPFFSPLPNRVVYPKEKWRRTNVQDLDSVGRYVTVHRYTYEGLEKNLDRIRVESSMTYCPPRFHQAELGFKIVKGDLESKEYGGAIRFDRRLGRIVRSDVHLRLAGSMTIDIGGMEFSVELDQTQRSILKTYDRNPLRKPE